MDLQHFSQLLFLQGPLKDR